MVFSPVKAAGWYFGILAFLISGEYIYYRTQSVYDYIQYKDISLAEPALAGQPITFVSVVKREKPGNLSWADSLYCDFGNGFGHFSQHISRRFQTTPTDGFVKVLWTYDEAVPKYSGIKCYLASITTLHLPFGITHQHRRVKSNVFTTQLPNGES